MNKVYKSACMGLCAMAFSTTLFAAPIQRGALSSGMVDDLEVQELYLIEPTSQPGDVLSIAVFSAPSTIEEGSADWSHENLLFGMLRGRGHTWERGNGDYHTSSVPVPEPSTMLLLGSGLFGLGLWWRKRA